MSHFSGRIVDTTQVILGTPYSSVALGKPGTDYPLSVLRDILLGGTPQICFE
jgi:hypothetical protein